MIFAFFRLYRKKPVVQYDEKFDYFHIGENPQTRINTAFLVNYSHNACFANTCPRTCANARNRAHLRPCVTCMCMCPPACVCAYARMRMCVRTCVRVRVCERVTCVCVRVRTPRARERETSEKILYSPSENFI